MKYRILLLSLLVFPILSVLAQPGGAIAYGDEVSGTINDDDPVHRWTFEGKAGDVITIDMTAQQSGAGGLDSYIQLLDSAGNMLADNDDASNATVDARIEAFALPTDDTYTIIASRFGLENGLAEGDYRLQLTLVAPPTAPTQPDGDTLSYNQIVSGTLNRQNFEDRWTFQGQAGEVITIRMVRSNDDSDLDSFLRLLDEEERELARNDDSDEGIRSSEIADFELPYSGSYTIIATRYGFESGTSSGGYTLEIVTGDSPSQDETQLGDIGTAQYGDFISGAIEGNEADVYDFQGQVGDVITISVKRTSGDLDPLLGILDADGAVLAENSSFNGRSDARIVGFSLPADGTYTVAILAETPSAGDYVLHLFAADSAAAAPSEPATEPLDLENATLVIVLSWQGTADFDLAVHTPNGETLDYARLESPSGGIFGGDANGGCTLTASSPSETVYWETPPPSGVFTINVAHVFPCDDTSPIAFTLRVTLNGAELEVIEGELKEGELVTYEIDLE